MLTNRSMPEAVIIPELAYPDVGEAVAWLCTVFGFSERLRIGNHRAQLSLGNASLVVTQLSGGAENAQIPCPNVLMVRVKDVDSHYAHVNHHSAVILHPPADYPYGERQYTVEDLGGHIWTFSETIADVDPQSWGGTLPDSPSI